MCIFFMCSKVGKNNFHTITKCRIVEVERNLWRSPNLIPCSDQHQPEQVAYHKDEDSVDSKQCASVFNHLHRKNISQEFLVYLCPLSLVLSLDTIEVFSSSPPIEIIPLLSFLFSKLITSNPLSFFVQAKGKKKAVKNERNYLCHMNIFLSKKVGKKFCIKRWTRIFQNKHGKSKSNP